MDAERLDGQRPARGGYPWWAWVIGVWFLFPLALMLIGVAAPQTRRYLGAPGIIGLTVALTVFTVVLGATLGDGTEPAPTPITTSTQDSASAGESEPVWPSPTSTSIAQCPTPAETVYFASFGEIFSPIPDALLGVGTLMDMVGSSPALLLDDDWKLRIALEFSALRLGADEIRDLSPPGSLHEIHNLNVLVADKIDDFADLLAVGVDKVDVDLLLMSAETLEDITELMELLRSKIEAHCQ